MREEYFHIYRVYVDDFNPHPYCEMQSRRHIFAFCWEPKRTRYSNPVNPDGTAGCFIYGLQVYVHFDEGQDRLILWAQHDASGEWYPRLTLPYSDLRHGLQANFPQAATAIEHYVLECLEDLAQFRHWRTPCA